MRQLQNPLHAPPQAPNEIRLSFDYSFGGEHLVNEGHEDGAHLLDYLLETTHALGLCSFGGLATAAEDILGFAVAFAAGLERCIVVILGV